MQPRGVTIAFDHHTDCFRLRWQALGGPCELLVDGGTKSQAHDLARLASEESWRIERKFSRYRDDSVLEVIRRVSGTRVVVDDETADLLDYAAAVHQISNGRFDVTSGVLRRLWTFDGRAAEPDPAALAEALSLVGWHRVVWERPDLMLPRGMQIDLGGIGKEYAVDRAAAIVAAHSRHAFLLNFGGDLFTPGPRHDGSAWVVGIDDAERTGRAATHLVELTRGGLATSGDARRYVMWRGVRLGHILDPFTGWPVAAAPRSVTVLAPTCLEAGTLATLAILSGASARTCLEAEGVEFELDEGPA